MENAKLKSEINETNILIAKFMDCLLCNDKMVKRTTKYWDFPGDSGLYCYIEDLRYNTSWDWLIPIVKRIVPPHGFTLSSIRYQTAVINSMHTLDINKVYNAVVEFIKQYNLSLVFKKHLND